MPRVTTLMCMLTLGSLAGCPAPRTRQAADSLPPSASQAAQVGPVFGTWTVTAFRSPGVSAMTGEEAARWKGRTIELSPQSAATGADACATPVYETGAYATDSLLAVDYRVTPGALGLPSGGTVEVTRVSCSGSPWPAPGGVLIHAGPDRAFTMWDGTFFELERHQDAIPAPRSDLPRRLHGTA